MPRSATRRHGSCQSPARSIGIGSAIRLPRPARGAQEKSEVELGNGPGTNHVGLTACNFLNIALYGIGLTSFATEFDGCIVGVLLPFQSAWLRLGTRPFADDYLYARNGFGEARAQDGGRQDHRDPEHRIIACTAGMTAPSPDPLGRWRPRTRGHDALRSDRRSDHLLPTDTRPSARLRPSGYDQALTRFQKAPAKPLRAGI